MNFILNGETIPTSGSGRVSVTDIGNSNETALICQSDRTTSEATLGDGNWYLDPEQESIPTANIAKRINESIYLGWTRNRATIAGHRIVRLKRVSDTATECRFTCEITGDRSDRNSSESVRGLLILHPSE